jgi:hypothetical protein
MVPSDAIIGFPKTGYETSCYNYVIRSKSPSEILQGRLDEVVGEVAQTKSKTTLFFRRPLRAASIQPLQYVGFCGLMMLARLFPTLSVSGPKSEYDMGTR